MKQTDVFDKLDKVIGDYTDKKANVIALFKAAYEANLYLKKHPHPHDVDSTEND